MILPSTSENNAENNLTELRDNVHNASLYFIDYNFLSYRNEIEFNYRTLQLYTNRCVSEHIGTIRLSAQLHSYTNQSETIIFVQSIVHSHVGYIVVSSYLCHSQWRNTCFTAAKTKNPCSHTKRKTSAMI